ncbi:MAG: hypothetical protein ACRDC6_29620 [Shewanella sp.]|uniref:hypothetical protein n=1 Tax=Aeromonas veronii TaxID=654 RepID=UPI003BA04382
MENHTDIKPIGQVWDAAELDEINAWSRAHPPVKSCWSCNGTTRRNVIPEVLPRLVDGTSGTYLVYGSLKSGLKIPVTPEQAQRHLQCLLQHLQEVRHG